MYLIFRTLSKDCVHWNKKNGLEEQGDKKIGNIIDMPVELQFFYENLLRVFIASQI